MKTANVPFSADVLTLNAAEETERIISWMRETVRKEFRRKGIVLGLSGGIDSSVCAALCVKAFGPEAVFGIMMPEQDSEDDSLALGELLAESLGIKTEVEVITPLLEGAGCYQRRDEAIRSVIPEYTAEYKSKIVLPNLFDGGYRIFSVVVQSPAGELTKARLPLAAYQTIVAATNFKQRCRKMMEYYHADRLNYAVCGTPNRLEYDQGFFVKNGDGAADIKPIAHLYKTQVYQLAEYLEVPEVIRMRPPTTDTYSLQQSQEEFYFAVSYDKLDLCLYAKNHGVPADEVAPLLNLSTEQIEMLYRDIDAKRRATRYQHLKPQLIENLTELGLT